MTNQSGGTGGVQDAAKQKAAELAGQAQQVSDSVENRAAEEADVRSTQAGEQVGSLGDAMHGASQQLRDQGNDVPAVLTDQVATRVEQLGRYLRETDGREILDDVQTFAREQPWLVAAVGLAAGVAAARLLKASAGGGGSSRPRPALPPTNPSTRDAGASYDAAAEDAAGTGYVDSPGAPVPPASTPGVAPYPTGLP